MEKAPVDISLKRITGSTCGRWIEPKHQLPNDQNGEKNLIGLLFGSLEFVVLTMIPTLSWYHLVRQPPKGGIYLGFGA
jgi:hypothetical protein